MRQVQPSSILDHPKYLEPPSVQYMQCMVQDGAPPSYTLVYKPKKYYYYGYVYVVVVIELVYIYYITILYTP